MQMHPYRFYTWGLWFIYLLLISRWQNWMDCVYSLCWKTAQQGTGIRSTVQHVWLVEGSIRLRKTHKIHLRGHLQWCVGSAVSSFNCCRTSGLGDKTTFSTQKTNKRCPLGREASVPLKTELIRSDKAAIIDFSCFRYMLPFWCTPGKAVALCRASFRMGKETAQVSLMPRAKIKGSEWNHFRKGGVFIFPANIASVWADTSFAAVKLSKQ